MRPILFLAATLPLFAQQTINVTGDAEIKVVPDQAVISLGVEVHSHLFEEARRENDRRVRAVRGAVARLGVAERDVQTDFIQVGIVYENDGVSAKYFNAQKSIVVVLGEISKLEAVLGSALDAGATHIHSVEFETTRLREYRDQARALAVKAAGEKARDLAAAAGLAVVGGPVNISSAQYGGGSWYGRGWYGSRGMAAQNVYTQSASDSAGAQGTIALGRISVTATVSMQFNIR